MLVLSRGVDERIQLGDDIELVVIAIRGSKVKLGIKAPDSMRVLRSELIGVVDAETKETTGGEA
ncbi:carbon storage regulator [bacterium]|nr:carbon storage regulator [bacterium]